MFVVGTTFAVQGSTLHGDGAYVPIAGLLIYTGSFAIGLGPVFWLLIDGIGGVGVFYLFGFMTLLALVYFSVRVPETKNLTLEQIERQVEGAKLTPDAIDSTRGSSAA